MLLSLLALPTIGLSVEADAQVQRSMINPGFEANDPPGSPGYAYIDNGDVPGWESTTGIIEIWDNGFSGVPSYEGQRFAEMNALAPGALYQSICLASGESFSWQFAHRGRSAGAATQTASFEVASTSGAILQSIGSSAVTLDNAWHLRSGTTTYTGASGIQRFQFTTADAGSYGNFLDAIQVTLKPFIEFGNSTTASVEGATAPNLPVIRVSGNLPAAVAVQVQVTGGTATLGSDYTTPNGTTSFTVTIPAGYYVGGEFPVGIAIVASPESETPETIALSLTPSPADYILSSTVNCGQSAIASAVHTITDPDPVVAADPDSATGINGATGAADVLNVLDGDTVNGVAATLSSVNVSVSSPATPINGGPVPVLNPVTSLVSVPAGTPAGTYNISYQICDKINTTSCATNVATVEVGPSPIFASGDSATGINGATGATGVVNAFSTDTLMWNGVTMVPVRDSVNGVNASPSNAILSVASGSSVPAGLIFDTATGNVDVAAGTPAGTYSFNYQLCERLNPTNCTTATISVTVAPTVDLSITKTNTPGQNGNVDLSGDSVVRGTATTYTIRVTNNGPDSVTGATVTDTPGTGLTCAPSGGVAITGNGIPSGSFTIGNLIGTGIQLGTLAAGQSAVLTFSCQVSG